MIPDRLQPLLAETKELADRFQDAGFHLYLVGGVVRDALLGRIQGHDAAAARDYDLDFTTDARPDEIEQVVTGWADALWLQGKRFGTIGLLKDGRRMEITTHRAEAYHPDSRKPDVSFADAVEADLSRRDFTVNAMALALPDVRLIDPFNGIADLAAHRLRTPLSPDISFTDDPLRMLRAARFIAGYQLTPDQELVDAVTRLRSRLDIVSDERIRDELDKLLVTEDPSEGLWFLVNTGLAEEFLPELPALALEQDPIHHHKDVLAHTIAVVAKCRPDRILRLAALFHDVGKPKTRSFGPGGLVSFHHHEVVGARMTRDRMRALRYPTQDIEEVTQLVELHLRFHTYRMGWTDSAVRRYVRDAGPLLERLNELTRCDCTTRNAAKARTLARRMDELEERIGELREREELAAMRPDLDGNEVMEHLGLKPGRDVGAALSFLLDLRLDQGPLSKDEATRRLDEWWSARRGAGGSGVPALTEDEG
ncbi:MAG TPA: CCA tRNA nucleotidyltransferase [Acidimicrobiales bacterium]|nr:CCA tRNA nucleotidyltransferase [Acidimicrobiales bacterium]